MQCFTNLRKVPKSTLQPLPHFTGQILDNMDIVDEDAYTLASLNS
jgi:hypothetical protein